MNEEDRNYFGDEDISEALSRFKRSLISGSKKYFDVSEFEGIVEYLLEEGDINASEIAARQGMQIHPNAVALHLKYAQVLLNKGKFEEVISRIELIENIENTNPDVYLIKGSAFLMLGDDAKARTAFRKAIKYSGNDKDDILYHIGSAHAQEGDAFNAIMYFERALNVNPKNEQALFELGFFCDQVGYYDKSIFHYNRYLDLDPFNHLTWFNLGITYNRAGSYEEAIKAYEYAWLLNESNYQSLFNLANAMANAGKYRDAIKTYKDFLKHDAGNDEAHCYIAECYLNLDDNVLSEKHYQKAIDLNQENDTAWFGLGLIMWIRKKFTESVVFVKKAIEFDDSNPEYWHTLAKIYTDFNHGKNALKAIKTAARLDPENVEIWLTWADLYEMSGEHESAARIIQTAVRKNSQAILKYRLTGLLLLLKKEKEAFVMLDKAMNQDFVLITSLYDFYPKALKSKKIKKLIDEFQKKDIRK